MKKLNILLLLSLVGAFSYVSAQTDSLQIPSENVEVIKRYEASILQAKKKKISFEIEKNERPPISYNYNVTTEKVIDFERPDPVIRALGYKGAPISSDDLKDGYIYGAYGTHNTINAGAAYHYYIEDWLDAGIRVDHLSAKDSIEGFNSKANNTQADIYLGYNLGTQAKLLLKGHSEFINHNAEELEDSLASLPINKYGVDLGFSHNVFEDKGFVVRLNGSYDYAVHKRDAEINDKIYGAELNVFKRLNEALSIEVPISYKRTSVTYLDTVSAKVSDFILEPNFRLRGQNYTAKGGVQFISGDSASYLFPIIDISLPAVIAGIDLRLFTESKYFRNSFYNISDINPYFLAISAAYTPNFRRAYNLELSYPYSGFDFKFGFGLSQYTNALNFFDLRNRRTEATYLDRDEFSIRPQIEYNFNELVTVGLAGRYNFFLTDLDSLPLTYQPKFILAFTSEQVLLDGKLVLWQSLEYNSARITALIPDDPNTFATLDRFMDIAFKVSYRISPTFDIFIKGTNLLGTDYVKWNNQNVFQQQIWGGLKLRI